MFNKLFYLFCLCFVNISFCLPHSFIFLSPHENIQYETCTCLNNKFTQNITTPYEKEINEWLFLTTQKTYQNPDIFLSSVINKSTVLNNLNSDFDSNILPLNLNSIIPDLCFQMSGQLTPIAPSSRRNYFTCINKHYNSTKQANLCTRTSPHHNSPKKCIALPIPCEDTNNKNIKCPERFKNRDNLYTKDNSCYKGASFTRRPCLNKNYISMISKTFHDVAQCLEVPTHLVFSILNHESRFILNAKSFSGALCATQVTSFAIADFNSFVDNKPIYKNMESLLSHNINKRCPQVWKHFKKVRIHYNTYNKKIRIQSVYDKCNLNTNPYTCFFYGLSYIKILKNQVEASMDKLNKIEIYKKEDKTFIFWGAAEKLKIEKQKNIKLQTTKIPIFRNPKLIDILVALSYNGGPSINSSLFKKYIIFLKTQLSKKENKKLRKQLLTTGLSLSYFIREFIPIIKREYPTRIKNKKAAQKRRNEVGNYLANIQNHLEALNNNISKKYQTINKPICPTFAYD